MERAISLKKMLLLGTIMIMGLAIAYPAMGAKTYRLYKMTGKITAIDHQYQTVVVNVPLANGQTFVVGGPLASNAILKKAAKSVKLADFHVGEKVVVEWAPTEVGHLIKMMDAA